MYRSKCYLATLSAVLVIISLPLTSLAEELVSRLFAADSSHQVLQGAKFFADANIYQAEPDKRRGMEGGLTVSKANLSYYTLVRVDVSSLPKRKPVRDAVLMLYLVGEAFEAPLDMICCALRADWDENTVTWNERRAETP